ncbi:MAG: SLC13 family permease [Acidimicrobiia bacterium]|nr:SLC13 family permease [Acidimicrobiia bacterium]MDH5294413.1 SLC13 family permease [Acidimicrobiia bacterium]
MGLHAWLTLAVVALVLFALVRDLTSPATAVFAGSVLLLVTGVIDTGEAFAGFSNPGPITVAALYVLAAAVEKTGALSPLMRRTLGERGVLRRPLLRLLVPTVGTSAFLNNTPIVAMLVPQVTTWADQRRISASKLLMPLSFGAILGGVITVIGTSTNLVVSGQMEAAGMEPIGFFEIGKIGLPVAILGTILIIALAPRLLPPRRSVREGLEEDSNRFTVEMIVEPGGALDGKTVEAAGLRHLAGVFLAAVDRGDTVIAPVRPETVLRGDNKLRFVGRADEVLDLRSMKGLRSAEEEHLLHLDPAVRYFEAVIGAESPLVGKTLVDVGFRSRYQAAVLAISRSGQLIDAKLGTVPLRVGDTLIVIADPGFRDRWRHRLDFILVAEMDSAPPTTSRNAKVVGLTLAALVILAAIGLVPILEGSVVVALLLIGLKILTPDEARRAVDLEVIGVIAAAFGLAAAVESSGLAQIVASGLVSAFDSLGSSGVLLGLVLATVVLTELITNNAAALLMFPIALAASSQAAIDPRGAAIAVAAAASASFLTPIGYQTNTMVYGPGGYRFSDYARLGTPLTVVMVATIVALVPVFWPT